MHVYHYAPYETTALTKLAARHGTREAELDNLLRAGVFVDVYAVVRGGIRTSQPSLSIKKLEPFYADRLGALRAGVTTAGDSIVEYAEARAALQAGDHQGHSSASPGWRRITGMTVPPPTILSSGLSSWQMTTASRGAATRQPVRRNRLMTRSRRPPHLMMPPMTALTVRWVWRNGWLTMWRCCVTGGWLRG